MSRGGNGGNNSFSKHLLIPAGRELVLCLLVEMVVSGLVGVHGGFDMVRGIRVTTTLKLKMHSIG